MINKMYKCPECYAIEDDQYTCTLCWCQGGEGIISEVDILGTEFEDEDLIEI